MSVSRREFLVAVGVAPVVALARGPQSPGGREVGSAGAAAPAAPEAPAAPSAAAAPVVSFHLDQPYLDLTGLEKPYVPPVGLRSGASLAELSEEQLLSRYYGSI